MPLSQNKIKFINSLKQKKFRNEIGLFVAEGEKIVGELIESNAKINSLYAVGEWLKANSKKTANCKAEINEISENELAKISSLTSPNKILAVIEKFNYTFNKKEIISELSLALEEIKDPGNLGTIIRVADWFGIDNIFCSENTVELYNPKVIQATMGSFLRVKVHYVDLKKAITDFKNELPVYAATTEEENIYKTGLTKNGLIIIGNESNGISKDLLNIATKKISIPNYNHKNNSNKNAESLNASIAAAIICSEFRREIIKP
ncbi:MAG: RNA methyltransferase [Bacteroidales bacterium]|nr:RNA methyltransferase [Bacteroidales bacterium]